MAAIIADRDGGQSPSAYKVELKSGDRLAGTGHLAAAHLADHSTAVAVLQACLKVYLFCVPILCWAALSRQDALCIRKQECIHGGECFKV